MAFPKDKEQTVVIHHYFHFDEAKVLKKLEVLETLLRASARREIKMGQEVEDLAVDVEESRTVQDGAIALLFNIKSLLDAAGTDPAKLKALSAALDSKKDELAAAIVANTPAAEEPPVE